MPTFLLADRDGNQLGPFRTSMHVWNPGDLIPRGHDTLRVVDVIERYLPVDGHVTLIVEPVQ